MSRIDPWRFLIVAVPLVLASFQVGLVFRQLTGGAWWGTIIAMIIGYMMGHVTGMLTASWIWRDRDDEGR